MISRALQPARQRLRRPADATADPSSRWTDLALCHLLHRRGPFVTVIFDIRSMLFYYRTAFVLAASTTMPRRSVHVGRDIRSVPHLRARVPALPPARSLPPRLPRPLRHRRCDRRLHRSRAAAPRGVTVNSFTSVSMDPPLILVALQRAVPSHDLLRGRCFTVNVLGAEQAELALHFAGKPRPVAAARMGRWRARPPPRRVALLLRVHAMGRVRRRGPHALPRRGTALRLPRRRRPRLRQRAVHHDPAGRPGPRGPALSDPSHPHDKESTAWESAPASSTWTSSTR